MINDILFSVACKLMKMRRGYQTPQLDSDEMTALHAALHHARLKVQELKRENSRLSRQNTIIKTRLFMVKL